MAMLVYLLVQTEISITIELIAIKFSTDIHIPQRMKPTDLLVIPFL